MALFETACTDLKLVHKEDDRQRLKQLAQATRKLRLAAEKLVRQGTGVVRARCDGGDAYHKRPS